MYSPRNIAINDSNSKESSRAIKELLKLMGRNRDRLHDSMAAEQRVTLEKYDDCVNEMYGLIELEIFSYAFRLGGRLMLAMLMDSGEDDESRKRPHSRLQSPLCCLSVGSA